MRTTYLIFSTPDLALAGMDSCFAFVRVDQHSIAKSVQRRAHAESGFKPPSSHDNCGSRGWV